jgi:purine-nucleoside phosphorylase
VTSAHVASFGAADAERAAAAVRAAIGDVAPEVAIILGSGLGGLAERIGGARRVAYGEIPGFPTTAVAGHQGALLVGTLGGREVLALAGRFHMYEGHDAALAGFPVRVAHALGARTLFVSNAAGGLRRTMRAGDLMMLADHINLAWRNPLVGPVEPGEARFPDMSAPYDATLRALLADCMRESGGRVLDGVYAWLTGPSYETPAEVRMLERLGADAVGMSTVPEVLVARALGLRVAGVSLIANLACGLSLSPITHDEVLEAARTSGALFERVVERFVRRMDG